MTTEARPIVKKWTFLKNLHNFMSTLVADGEEKHTQRVPLSAILREERTGLSLEHGSPIGGGE